jgi:drug/metabolite transporter (DMT)-like permease
MGVLPDLWILATLAAACFQTLRFMLQKHLSTAILTATGATFARFVYSAPLVALLMAAYLHLTAQTLPSLSAAFWAYGAAGGLAQILATVCVVLLFKSRNFAVGITLKKTEVLLTVLVGWVVLGEGVSAAALAAMALGLVGVLLLSAPPGVVGWGLRALDRRVIGLGLASGLFFAVSGVCYRGASLEIASADPLLRAGVTLAAVTAMQTLAMAVWLHRVEPGQIGAVWRARRVAGWIGLTSMAGSFCWFTAFTLQVAAYVNALGQVELILSLLATVLVFRERVGRREMAGIAVLGLSIVALVMVV